ncbi:G patch domain-containing protein 4 [Plakobranchus ocellatus]|uniref:G patch domain-containing protein 4 n=1 Tax=Plakobranchus ocellatus TaxID=259542 RepID=A0AAV4C5Q8_9GAST|nr:G patch domain-containing protein 4 [Plakobranchus ocellatus]
MSNSEFAKRQMKKHGWKEGSGLGKEEDGRSEPIKVSLKMDKAGVGHDPGKEFTDHWWLRVFNEAAQKIGNKDEGISKQAKSKEEKAKTKKEEQRKKFYNGFVQSTVLTNGVEEKNINADSSSEDEKEESNNVSIPTLDDIHKFCGGATGHKAARFGIKMEGKIKRVTHQETQFEEKSKASDLNDNISDSVDDNSLLNPAKKKKKKKKKENGELRFEETKDISKRKMEEFSQSEIEEMPSKSKKHKKKKKSKEEKNVCETESVSEKVESTENDKDCGGETVTNMKKRKIQEPFDDVCESESSMKKKKKKRKKNRD